MYDLRRENRRLAVIAVFALGACAGGGLSPAMLDRAPAGVAAGWIQSDGVRYHRPHYAPSRYATTRIAPAFFYVPYLGGLVVVSPKFYFDFWGYRKYGDPRDAEPLLKSYAKAMGGSAHNNIETQYYEKQNGKKTYITNPGRQYGGSWEHDSVVPKKPTQAQIAAEALKAVKHFGYDPNGVYVVATPHDRSEEGFPTDWCSYHSSVYLEKDQVPYIYLPYMPDGGVGCGAKAVRPPRDESAEDEGVTIMAGHEFGESITDPVPSTAWDGPQGEIADQCRTEGIANEPFRNKSFTMQPMASDADNACVQSYP